MADELPSDVMYNIFSRLPVETLACCRCVSNPWCNYINDSYIETMYSKVIKDPMLIVTDDTNSLCKLSFLEYNKQQPDDHTIVDLQPRKKPPIMEFPCKDWSFRYPDDVILGCCNGLLFSSLDHHDGTALVIIHPLRKEWHVLPPITTPQFGSQRPSLRVGFDGWSDSIDFPELPWFLVDETYGLGFDDSTKTFKMVTVMLRIQDGGVPVEFDQLKENLCTMVHVLGTGSGSGSWRKIDQVPYYPITGEGVFANGRLHWLISDERGKYYPTYHFGTPVVWFDMTKEEFGLIEPPKERPSGEVRERLVDLHGQLGYVYNIMGRGIEVWVLNEKKWVMHCWFEQKPPLSTWLAKVLGFWNGNGDVLVKDNQKIFVYNLKEDVLYEVLDDWGRESESERDIRIYHSHLFSSRRSIKN